MFRSTAPTVFLRKISFGLATGLLLFSGLTGAQDTEPAWVSAGQNMEVGAPITHEGLAIFPIRLSTPVKPKGDVLTLREALAIGVISVREQGEGNVPELTVINTGSKAVLLAVGDVIQGGRQDRVIVSDALIPPTKQSITVAVNCVESGRWSPGAQGIAFSYGGRGESALKKVLEVDRSQQSTWTTVARLNADKSSRIARLANAETERTLPDQLRSIESQTGHSSTGNVGGLGILAQENFNQNGLVQQFQTASDGSFMNSELNPSTGTYMASLASDKVVISLQPYLDALNPLLEESDLIGIVAALNGTIINAELYGNKRLFTASGKDMIRALSLDALSRPENEEAPIAMLAVDAAQFLAQAMAGNGTIESNHLGQRTRRTSAGADAFEFRDTKGSLLHLSAYAH
jgi:hypothetical protein